MVPNSQRQSAELKTISLYYTPGSYVNEGCPSAFDETNFNILRRFQRGIPKIEECVSNQYHDDMIRRLKRTIRVYKFFLEFPNCLFKDATHMSSQYSKIPLMKQCLQAGFELTSPFLQELINTYLEDYGQNSTIEQVLLCYLDLHPELKASSWFIHNNNNQTFNIGVNMCQQLMKEQFQFPKIIWQVHDTKQCPKFESRGYDSGICSRHDISICRRSLHVSSTFCKVLCLFTDIHRTRDKYLIPTEKIHSWPLEHHQNIQYTFSVQVIPKRVTLSHRKRTNFQHQLSQIDEDGILLFLTAPNTPGDERRKRYYTKLLKHLQASGVTNKPIICVVPVSVGNENDFEFFKPIFEPLVLVNTNFKVHYLQDNGTTSLDWVIKSTSGLVRNCTVNNNNNL